MTEPALAKELTRVLRALELQELPEAVIAAVVDTGGTALREPALDAHLEGVTLEKLGDVNRVLTKYIRRFWASQREATLMESDENEGGTHANADEGGGGGGGGARGSSPLWAFLASDVANDKILGHKDGRAHQYAAHRAFFTVLQGSINIAEGYAEMEMESRVEALLKALVASNVYLNWLQLPGGSAYGLFMPFVYRQMLDILKKCVEMVSLPQAPASGSASSQQQERTPRKRGTRSVRNRRQHNGAGGGISHDMQKRVIGLGSELLDTLVLFLQHFALSSSKESIVPTIETVIHIQIVGSVANSVHVTSVVEMSQRILAGLMNEMHGDIFTITRAIIHCYIRGVSFQEASATEIGSALKFHKIAIEGIGLVQTTLAKTLKSAHDHDEESADQVSSLHLGIVQNICLNAPDRSEDRHRVLGYVFQVCLSRELQEQDRVLLVRFLFSYAKSVKTKFRQFAVELVGRLILEPSTWNVASSMPDELEKYVGVAPLLELLADRSRDKISSVRAKAIGAVSSVLTAALKNSPLGTAHAYKIGDDDGGNEETDAGSDPSLIGASLSDILYTRSEETGKLKETALMLHLVGLFREGIQDEKTFVRKAAIQALEALIVVRPAAIHPSMRQDLFDMQARCTDTSLSVRVQAVKSLSSVLLKFPEDEEAQRLWSLGVLPLCVDPEATVQAASLELVNRVIFDRLSKWYNVRHNAEQHPLINSVWPLVSHLDGVMIKCAQKALRLLLKNDKVNARQITKAAIFAIKTCLTKVSDGDEADSRYWVFSWILLEELAYSDTLIDAAKSEKHNMGIIVESWNTVQADKLPQEFAEGSKRILRVIAALAPVMDAQDAKEIADSILSSLHSFAIPLNVMADAVLALQSICKSKAASPEKGRAVCFGWGQQLLDACESNLRLCFDGDAALVVDQTTLIQKQIICVGEVALLEFQQDEEKNRESGISLIPIDVFKPLIQLFLSPDISPNGAPPQKSPPDGDLSPASRGEVVSIPLKIRVCAFVTLGKLCLRDQDLAKSCMTMFIRELRTCKHQDIRSNILLILGDLCIRYTALVDVYIPTIALSFLDRSPLIRRNALLLFSQLVLQDYIKWRESLLRFFLRAVVDENEELSNLARHILCGPLLLKAPHLFTNKFIEMIFVFNKFEGKVNFSEPFEREGVEEIALPGSSRYRQRSQLYRFLLQNMSDEQKLQISMKLCTEVLEEVSEGKLKLCDNPSQISDFGTEAILKDTFAILCSPDIKLSTARDQDGGDEDGDEHDEEAEGLSVAAKLAAAKGKLLSKMSKKNFLENVVPVLIGLKHRMDSKRSPLMRYLMHYIRELLKLYGQEVRDILSTDSQMAMEIEYDLRQYELQQKHSHDTRQNRRKVNKNSSQPDSRDGTPSRFPLQNVDGSNTPQLLSASSKASRRQSLPSAGTPSHPVRRRNVSSDDELPSSVSRSTMIFSPDKGVPKDKWRVTAKSPAVTKNAHKSSSSSFTQETLEENMQRDLASAFDAVSFSAPSSPEPSPDKEVDLVPAVPEADDSDDETAFTRLPLRKKQKQKARSKSKSKASKREQEHVSDPPRMNALYVNNAKRKR